MTRTTDGVARRSTMGRILSLLDTFVDRSDQSLSELSRRSTLPLTTTHRLVREMEQLGILERDHHGRYRVGLRLWQVATTAPRAFLRDAAMPFLEELHEATHEHVQLAVREGTDAVYLERICGAGAVPVLTKVGARWPLHATGVGLVLLAYADGGLQETVLSMPLTRFTPSTIVNPLRLREILAEIRRTGVAVSEGQRTLDALSVAAPIRSSDGTVVAALSLVVPTLGTAPPRYISSVVAAARGISMAVRLREQDLNGPEHETNAWPAESSQSRYPGQAHVRWDTRPPLAAKPSVAG
jgi:DNA-binding IclR family transcriptional regulator